MWLLLSFLACKTPEAEPPAPIIPGPPMAGAAQGTLDMPIGTPMGGYSDRAKYLGGESQQDERQCAYNVGFVESTGIHTRPGIKVVWVTNGDQDLVITQTDTIYSFDGLVDAVTAELETRTGKNLHGRVVHSANHSHQSWGPFSDQTHFYLGGDKFNREIFQRFVDQIVAVAMDAYEHQEAAAIGTGWAKDWDPDDKVYHDRRSDNDQIQMFDDLPPGGYGKDPYLNVIRVDTAAGEPLAMMFTMPVHGTAVGSDSSLVSAEASAGIVAALEEEFDSEVIVMHLQSAAGDASPGGVDRSFARVESLGEFARDPIMELWANTPTSAAPIHLESVTRHIWQQRDQIKVTRNGTVDWTYTPYSADNVSDEVIYDENGAIKAPIDEFNAQYGAVFCGSEDALIPAGYIGSRIYPYSSCTDVGLISRILLAIFDLQESDLSLPLPESMKAGTLATRFGPIPTLLPDGSEVEQDLYAAFFPGEPTSMYVEQARRRIEAELGYNMPLIVGYAQDHEGYFLPPEDWLAGGYEPNINIWGPLQAEHVLEGVLEYSKAILSTDDVAEDADPDGYYASTEYPDRPMPTEFIPDTTDEAGTLITETPEYFWLPPNFVAQLVVPEEVPRVSGVVQMAWYGGDPMVDLPRVVLEKKADNGNWEEVTMRSGRAVTDTYADMLMAYTPDPLYPITADQKHQYWISWQAVSHIKDRTGLPTGTYRLHVDGKKYAGGSTHYPWNTEAYTVDSPEFEVVPATISVEPDATGVWVSLHGPSDGWRLIDVEGDSVGNNPVRGPLTVVVNDGAPQTITAEAPSGGRSHVTLDVTNPNSVTVTDSYGNTGTYLVSGRP